MSREGESVGGAARYGRQLWSLWRSGGARAVARKLRERAATALAPKEPVMEVKAADICAADLLRRPGYRMPSPAAGEPPRINWITVPHAPGSGGGTTIFRIINYLQRQGFSNSVYFYDVYGGDHAYYAAVARSYYGFEGPVAKVEDGMEDAHAVVATAWATAYPAYNSTCSGRRFYFVQDFEPYFHPASAASIMAENTYRMGFHGITAGRWLAEKLRAEYGMSADHFDFGCDTGTYHRSSDSIRNGIVFYARPGAPRRGFELGLMALEVLAARRPDVSFHLYGQKLDGLPFRVVDHGKVTPAQLNRIYNQCFAGLSLSMTNVSLVPYEMLAAGCIPVVNDAHHNRVVLDNDYVRYSAPDPHSLAATLESVVDECDFPALSAAASASIRSASWDDAGAAVEIVIRRELRGG